MKGEGDMAKRIREPITVKATCLVNGERVDVDTLTPEQKKKLAVAIRVTMLNELYAGQAKFYPKEEKTGKRKKQRTKKPQKEITS